MDKYILKNNKNMWLNRLNKCMRFIKKYILLFEREYEETNTCNEISKGKNDFEKISEIRKTQEWNLLKKTVNEWNNDDISMKCSWENIYRSFYAVII